MFDPALIGREEGGIGEMIYNSAMKCDIDLRRDLLNNVILGGGNTMFNGFAERVQIEISKLIPRYGRTHVVSACDRNASVITGACILASLSSFDSMWISKEEFDEEGPPLCIKNVSNQKDHF